MTLEQDKVSIIMATYNRAHFIVESLKSIKNQTYQNWECIIIDDGGEDNTPEVISPILKEDSRFLFFKRPNTYKKGLPGSRNYGLDIATGNYIIFFDDDDIAHPLNLELCVKALSNKAILFCRYIREVFTGSFRYNFEYSKDYTFFSIDKSDIDNILKNELPINSCAVMWKKACFIKHRFTESLMYAEEWELYSRLIISGAKGISINKTLYYGRKHNNSNTGEFWSRAPLRVESKKKAIELVVDNLYNAKLLTPSLFKYLIHLAIPFRDLNLIKYMLNQTNSKFKVNLFYKMKYYTYPIWVFYMNTIKHNY